MTTYRMPNSFYRKLDNPIGLANIQLCPYYSDGSTYTNMLITRIHTPPHHRGKGIARELLTKCLTAADKTQTTLWLEIVPEDDLTSYDRLHAWYTKNGFRDVGGVFRRKPAKLEAVA